MPPLPQRSRPASSPQNTPTDDKSKIPEKLRPFIALGLDVAWAGLGENEQAVGDCPFCGRNRFYIGVSTGQWDCKVCGQNGNIWTFLRLFWALCKPVDDSLIEQRRLLSRATIDAWGVKASYVNGEVLVPSFSLKGEIVHLYRFLHNRVEKRWILYPLPGLSHNGLFGYNLYDPKKPDVYLCEGPWDGMALWEVMRSAKTTDEGYTPTGVESISVLRTANVVATPGCNVFREDWLPAFASKNVHIGFDNDWAKTLKGKGGISRAGYDGSKRVAGILSAAEAPPTDIKYLSWGEAGYTKDLPDRYDVRDLLSESKAGKARSAPLSERVENLRKLLFRYTPIPDDWVLKAPPVEGVAELESLPCSSWLELLTAWKRALHWRNEMTDVLAVALAVCLSTDQQGDQQLFLQIIGDAGSAKTRFCDGMLVSKKCVHLEHLTGFFSGYKDGSGKDFSLLARINHRTLITPEGDVIMSSSKFDEIMSQQRRIFDGTATSTYKNLDEDRRYSGLRTPWIMAGTPAMLSTNQSRLGDRFLKICLSHPDEETKHNILMRVGYTAMRSVKVHSAGAAEGHIEEHLRLAYQLTGGFVDHLRENADTLLDRVQADEERVMLYCATLAQFTSDMRARPDTDKRKQEVVDTKEMPTRLMHQYVRLAWCLAAFSSGSRTIDSEVLRRVRKVAIDTAHGKTLQLAGILYKAGQKGRTITALAVLLGESEEKVRQLLRFLSNRNIEVAEHFDYKQFPHMTSGQQRWRLTRRFTQLYKEVIEDAPTA